MGDLRIYQAGIKILSEGGNPYASQEWRAYWSLGELPPMVWNPPFFLWLASPLLSLPLPLAKVVVLTASNFFMVQSISLAWRIVSTKACPIFYSYSFAVLSIPFLLTLYLGQIDAFLLWILVSGLYFYSRKMDFLAGSILSVLLIKPHIFYLTLVALYSGALIQRRYLLLFGSVISTLVLAGLPELFHPGILIQWLSRDQWPIVYTGSTLVSLIRSFTSAWFFKDWLYLSIFIPGTCTLLVFLMTMLKGHSWAYKILPVTMLLSPLLAPFGFVFDQIAIVVSFVWLLAAAVEQNMVQKQTQIFLAYCFCFIIPSLGFLTREQVWGSPIWWFLPPIVGLIGWGIIEVRVQSRQIVSKVFH